MTENNIKLVNEDGKIVGKDPETGETVPIELGETIVESLSTEESRTDPRRITIGVPSDFGTVAAALDEVRSQRTPPGVQFEIVIQSGHIFQQGIFAEQEFLGHVKITSEDATVQVDPELTNPGSANDWVFFGRRGTVMPQLEVLFDGGGATNLQGVLYSRKSSGFIGDGAGFQSMGVGISASGQSVVSGHVSGTNTVARDMSSRGVNLHNAHANLEGVDASNCDDKAARLAEGSSANLRDMNAAGSKIGLRATTNCRATVRGADLSGGSQGISIVGLSTVDAVLADVSGGSSADEIVTNSGSLVAAHNCTTTNGDPDIGDTNVSSFNSLSADGVIFA